MCYSRIRYVEFTRRQDEETLLSCLVHAFHYFGGVSECILTDRMKTVLVEQVDGELHWNTRFLDFASYYGFVPRVCRPYRPETKGKIESTIRFVKQNFWPGIQFVPLPELNTQAREWMERVNRQVHATTREVPYERLAKENLLSIAGHPDYDTSYVEERRVAKDCPLSYRGNRYSVPWRHVGKTVLVKEPVEGGRIRIYDRAEGIAEHVLAEGRGVMVMEPEHYRGLAQRDRGCGPAPATPPQPCVKLAPGPGVGRGFVAPEVEQRSLSIYEEVADVVAI
ncbi:MAG: Mu transposase domain-containing protein [Terriglobales bacterium]